MSNQIFLIGLDNYKYQKKLNSSVRGCNDFKNLLVEKYDFQESDIYELYNEDATNKKIQDAFKGYSKTLSNDDNLIIFYSGHGEFDDGIDRGYWIPYSGEDYTTYIPNETILSYLEKFKCKHLVLISDCCFSNSLLSTNASKSSRDYFDKDSRWALTSAFNEAKDSDEESNTLFTEIILDYLTDNEEDFRISQLIEEVKNKFSINQFQTPQGAPLMLTAHRGGEFIFKIKNEVDNRNVKGYLDFEKILKLYRRNSVFTLLEEKEDRTAKIGYKLFREFDNVSKRGSYYLYLYEGINIGKTHKYLNDNHSIKSIEKKLIVFIPKERNQTKLETRKKNVSDKFRPINIFYLDEFIKEECTPKIIKDEDDTNYLNISNFIIPNIKSLPENHSNINIYIEEWLLSEAEPILVVKGTGGIGKTTFAQYIADISNKKLPENNVLFIDSLQIKDYLIKNKNQEKLSLYNFYEALCDISDVFEEKLSEELFRLNIDAGNLLIIIDGLDEVISKLNNFDVENFLNTIKEYSSQIGGGKVIITCRTYFWDKSTFSENKYHLIELTPFTEQQAEQFFKKSFNNEIKKVSKALKIAKNFKTPNSHNNEFYHPYVLDIIRSIIEYDEATLFLDFSNISSRFLAETNKTDYIIYKVCEREVKRVNQIKIDDQLDFFIYLSTMRRGILDIDELGIHLKRALKVDINDVNIEAFKSHPFLKRYENKLMFRYDFLEDVFKSIYIANLLNSEELNFNIDSTFLDIITDKCWFGSPLNSDISNRMKSWAENELLVFNEILEKVNVINDLSLTANLFSLAMTIQHKFKQNNVIENTSLLKDLFGRGNQIEKLSLRNINKDHNIKFDFTGLIVRDSTFDNYNLFWDCTFNDESKFIDCSLINIKNDKKNQNIKASNFINCSYDSEIENSLKKFEAFSQNRNELLKNFVSDFFHLFYSNGKLGRQWEDKIIKPRFPGINRGNIDYNKLIKLLKKNRLIIITIEMNRNKLSISEDKKEEIIKFIKDGTISQTIGVLINDLI